MNGLEKQHIIKTENLNKTYYFQSILQEACRLKLLSDSEFEHIQLQSIQLLAKQTEYYTNGESSSVKVEIAQSILQSIFYCIGIYLKSFPDIDLSIDVLKQKPLSELFKDGKKLIVIQLESAKQLLASIQKDSIVTDNIAYNDTVPNGLTLFFSKYDIDFATHEIPASIDYPLSNDMNFSMPLVGIEYIYNYLQILTLENDFCKHFATEDINQLLRGYDDHYQDLLINIFELVLTNALGSVLRNKNALQLNIEPLDREYLFEKLANLSKDKLDTILQSASKQLCIELNISDESLKKHILTTVINLSKKLRNALEIDQLESIFINFKTLQTQPIFQFEDGKKLNDKLFRSVADEIRECRFASDKIAIIQREIHNINDLVDILEGYCIFGNEFTEIFQSFGDLELALLFKKLPSNMLDSDYHLTDNEKEWQAKLNSFFKEIDLNRNEEIRTLAEKIDLD